MGETRRHIRTKSISVDGIHYCVYCGNESREDSSGGYHNNDYDEYQSCDCKKIHIRDKYHEKIRAEKRRHEIEIDRLKKQFASKLKPAKKLVKMKVHGDQEKRIREIEQMFKEITDL